MDAQLIEAVQHHSRCARTYVLIRLYFTHLLGEDPLMTAAVSTFMSMSSSASDIDWEKEQLMDVVMFHRANKLANEHLRHLIELGMISDGDEPTITIDGIRKCHRIMQGTALGELDDVLVHLKDVNQWAVNSAFPPLELRMDDDDDNEDGAEQ